MNRPICCSRRHPSSVRLDLRFDLRLDLRVAPAAVTKHDATWKAGVTGSRGQIRSCPTEKAAPSLGRPVISDSLPLTEFI